MSTLALRAAGVIASAVEPKPGLSFVTRLLAAREDQAKQRVLGHLAAMDNSRLAGLGFTANDIRALRAGELRIAAGKTVVVDPCHCRAAGRQVGVNNLEDDRRCPPVAVAVRHRHDRVDQVTEIDRLVVIVR